MSTRYEILAAKSQHTAHLNAHHCTLTQQCPVRRLLWDHYMVVSANWGRGPTYDEDQRRQFHESQQGTGP
jgi:hypothetical protein